MTGAPCTGLGNVTRGQLGVQTEPAQVLREARKSLFCSGIDDDCSLLGGFVAIAAPSCATNRWTLLTGLDGALGVRVRAVPPALAKNLDERFRHAAIAIVFLIHQVEARAIVEQHIDLTTGAVTARNSTRLVVQIDGNRIDASPEGLCKTFGLAMHVGAQLVG
jgi:hypothetical protein